jgi:hypothetical protein
MQLKNRNHLSKNQLVTTRIFDLDLSVRLIINQQINTLLLEDFISMSVDSEG